MENSPMKTYNGLTITLGIFTLAHLIIDVIFYVPLIGRMLSNIPTILLIILGITGLAASLGSYILSFVALSRNFVGLIRRGEGNGYILLVCILINFFLLAVSLYNPNSIFNMNHFGA
ncbi:MAG: hypothetical protein RL641_185 [Candidatus Parcubacteria bacterium]|jgi:hypothetical protein